MANIKIINLSSPDDKPMMIEETRLIKIGRDLYERPTGILKVVKQFLNKHTHIEKTVFLDITDIKIDSHLIVRAKMSLFSILCGTEKIRQRDFPLEVKLNQLEEPFYLLFNTNQIVDCDATPCESELRTFYISYRIVLKDKEGEIINGIDENGNEGILEEIGLQFILEKNKPELKFIPDDSNNPLQYKSEIGEQRIGSLVVLLPNTLKYAPKVDFNAKIIAYDESKSETSNILVIKL